MTNELLSERSKAPDFEHWESPETHVRWERGLAIVAGMILVVLTFFLLLSTLPLSSQSESAPITGIRQVEQAQPPLPQDQPAASPTAQPAPDAEKRLSALSRAFPNVRKAPSLDAPIATNLKQGQRVDVVGRSTDHAWLQILNPDNSRERLWVSADMLEVTGDPRTLPVGLP